MFGESCRKTSISFADIFRITARASELVHKVIPKNTIQLIPYLKINSILIPYQFHTNSIPFHINSIPKNLFVEGYQFVSFDVVSLFTNVPLTVKTVNIILERVYTEKLINTKLSKRSLKKLILDSCNQTAFSFNNKIYEQIAVSMGSSLGPVLANIILTEFEKLIVFDLVDSGLIKFYRRYVDDTLILVKPNNIPLLLKKFNSFHKNLKFTVDRFENDFVHFLDIKISCDGTDVDRKSTHSGQYTHFSSFEPFVRKTAPWIKSLFHRAFKICSTQKLFDQQIGKIKTFMAWNGFPTRVKNAIINRLLRKHTQTQQNNNNETLEDIRPKIYGFACHVLVTMVKISFKLYLRKFTVVSNSRLTSS